MPQATHLAKEIKIAIDLKVGNTNPDPEDFFQDNTNNVGDDEFSEDSLLVEQHVPREIMATTTAQPNSPRQITAAPAVPLENNTAIGTVTTTKKKTRTNQIVTAMKSTTEETRSSYSSIMEQRLYADETEMRLRRLEREAAEEQHRIDQEEDRRRREEQEEIWRQEREERRLEREEERRAREEAEERRRRDRKEERSHQQQQLLAMMQVVMSGAMAFMGIKHGRDSDGNNPSNGN